MTAFGGAAVSTSMAAAAVGGGTSVLTMKNKATLTTMPVVDGGAGNVSAGVSGVGMKTLHYLQGRNNSKGWYEIMSL